jgi:hypothetical protein
MRINFNEESDSPGDSICLNMGLKSLEIGLKRPELPENRGLIPCASFFLDYGLDPWFFQ